MQYQIVSANPLFPMSIEFINEDGQTIVISGSGAYAGFVTWWEIPVYVSDAFSIKPLDERLNAKFCFYFL